MPRQTLYVQPNGMLIVLMEMEGHDFESLCGIALHNMLHANKLIEVKLVWKRSAKGLSLCTCMPAHILLVRTL